MTMKDVENRSDIESIVRRFYDDMLHDPIIGFIFVDIAKIDLESHLPTIVDFWCDVVFKSKQKPQARLYQGNALRKHLELNQQVQLRAGHFTRWLYLFNRAVRAEHTGKNAELMIERAELVAKSISAAIDDRKKSEMNLVLPVSNSANNPGGKNS